MNATMTERIWIMLAAVMVAVAGAFLWRNNVSAAFVTATLGAVAWFLSYRVQMHAKLAATEEGSNEQETHEEADEK
jgi:hypothetical protein